ncbi:anti-sigma factor RsbA family regulatory protein [Acrocarpospora macrocephala]|uniref:Anti-sigma regulatory factor n=1 Tax=Acrocarpospora macrocephala TaxID=150177 RepID=A0A5M3WPL4_9ACTN|nr:sensor histidine kinase [Acrocarpospora macrocephala]GES10884.1 anti-sigma regulatory factor [Acrocarpospora macrocephala]
MELVTFVPVQVERAPLVSEPFAHVAVAYGSGEEYLKTVLPALLDGLRRGERTILLGPEENLELVRAALGADATRVELGLSQDWYGHPARTMAAYLDFARRNGPARMICEPVWRSARDAAEWTRIEAIANVAFAGIRTTMLCVYRNPGEEVFRSHPWYLDGEVIRASEPYLPPERMDWEQPAFESPPAEAEGLDFDLPGVRRMRAFVRDQAYAAGLERDEVTSLVLAAAEIAANAVEHGAGHGRVAVWRAGDELICEITNPDAGIEVPFPGYIPPEHESLRGYGLWISRQLCDVMEVRTLDGKSCVRLHMRMTL